MVKYFEWFHYFKIYFYSRKQGSMKKDHRRSESFYNRKFSLSTEKKLLTMSEILSVKLVNAHICIYFFI